MSRSCKPGQNPGGKRKAKWDYTPVPNGTSTVGFLAGPPCGVYVHHAGTSKPCRRILTKSALVCPYCESQFVPVWRGYTPFYSQDYFRLFVLIPEELDEAVSEIDLHTQIRISRPRASKASVIIRAENWRTLKLPVTADRLLPVDLFPFLPAIWRDIELAKWLNDNPEQCEEKPHPERVGNAVPADQEWEKLVDGVKSRIGIMRDGELRALGEPLPVPSQNGKHNKAKPK